MEIAHHNSAVEHQWTEESYICEIILNHIEFIGDDCSGEIVHPDPDIFWLYIFFVKFLSCLLSLNDRQVIDNKFVWV